MRSSACRPADQRFAPTIFCLSRHRSQEFVEFLARPEKEVSPDLDIHLNVDTTAPIKVVQCRLNPKKRRRFHFHFTPTSSSWLNQVERWFALINDRMIRRSTFLSVHELEQVIYEWLANWNNAPKPFVWKATAEAILDKVQRCKELAGTAH